MALTGSGGQIRAHLLDSIRLADEQQEQPILADMHLSPTANPQLEMAGSGLKQSMQQFVIAATPHKVAKLRVNSCRRSAVFLSTGSSQLNKQQNISISRQALADECQVCQLIQDPLCGWCSTSGSCSTRDECLESSLSTTTTTTTSRSNNGAVNWQPFDAIKCQDYFPVAPSRFSLQTTSGSHQNPAVADVNLRLDQSAAVVAASTGSGLDWPSQLAHRLAHAQFACHFIYGTSGQSDTQKELINSTIESRHRPEATTTTTKAGQARLNLHTSTLTIGCPLAPQRPRSELGVAEHPVHLSLRLAHQDEQLNQLLGLQATDQFQVERLITLFDCSAHTSCGQCTTSGQSNTSSGQECVWCLASQRCTSNSSDAELGCQALAGVTSGAQSQRRHLLRNHQHHHRFRPHQHSLFGSEFVDRSSQCPPVSDSLTSGLSDSPSTTTTTTATTTTTTTTTITTTADTNINSVGGSSLTGSGALLAPTEILIPNDSRRSLHIRLRHPLTSGQLTGRRTRIECQIEMGVARARLPARMVAEREVSCQEHLFGYQDEQVATQQILVSVLLNGEPLGLDLQPEVDQTQLLVASNQSVALNEPTIMLVIVYKCHLFGLNQLPDQLDMMSHQARSMAHHSKLSGPQTGNDCSMCLNVERRFGCAWCGNQCRHAPQCTTDLAASTCPPPRIDAIYPSSGPLEGGTLLTIEGSNLGSSERDVHDKISVGGEPCELVLYSVSTRIVCRTGAATGEAQLATVFVGNPAGVTSAHEKFHYKAVQLTDVQPRQGPVSGGTRLHLRGLNLNIGSRVQVLLDDTPCAVDSHEMASNQITCVTAPYLLGPSARVSRLTLRIDNSTHHLAYPFTYQPDPIITSIEPAESFVSGGRLLLIGGQHLSSPQSTKLVVYHEHRHALINATSCAVQNDTLLTCLTPALPRDQLASFLASSTVGQTDWAPASGALLDYQRGPGLRLKMSLVMDDVRSVRNLDEYYHHLPHYLTYFEDPQLFRLPALLSHEWSAGQELVIQGEHLAMRQLDQDMLITIGPNICPIKSIQPNRVICEPPARIQPVYDDETGQPLDKAFLPIVGLVGANLRFQIGQMQYSASQYLQPTLGGGGGGQRLPGSDNPTSSAEWSSNPAAGIGLIFGADPTRQQQQQQQQPHQTSGNLIRWPVAILVLVAMLILAAGFVFSLMFALARFRNFKAEREYRRIQLQMGALDAANGQPLIGTTSPAGLFLDHTNGHSINQQQHQLHLDHQHNYQQNVHQNNHNSQQRQHRSPLEAFSGVGKRLMYPFVNQHSFPPSPLTDISSLNSNHKQQQQHQTMISKLLANGNVTTASYQNPLTNNNNNNIANTNNNITHQSNSHTTTISSQLIYGTNAGDTSASGSCQSSPGSARDSTGSQPPITTNGLLIQHQLGGTTINQFHNNNPASDGSERSNGWIHTGPLAATSINQADCRRRPQVPL